MDSHPKTNEAHSRTDPMFLSSLVVDEIYKGAKQKKYRLWIKYTWEKRNESKKMLEKAETKQHMNRKEK